MVGAGADFVMAGGMFASHLESGGEVIEINGKLFKQFYGVSVCLDVCAFLFFLFHCLYCIVFHCIDKVQFSSIV